MGMEIERKFLLVNDDWRQSGIKGLHLSQGYLNEEGNTVRVRTADDKGYLTIKSKTKGISRMEFEYEIPLGDAMQLLTLSQTPVVEKYRYRIPFEGHLWEVDEFCGDNSGLVVAEVELKSEEEPYVKPAWIGEEVSADKRYRNTNLAKRPYKEWEK
jgi:adenylate cyclase